MDSRIYFATVLVCISSFYKNITDKRCNLKKIVNFCTVNFQFSYLNKSLNSFGAKAKMPHIVPKDFGAIDTSPNFISLKI